jgi:two-component system, LuxR family, sensor kinase FixL
MRSRKAYRASSLPEVMRGVLRRYGLALVLAGLALFLDGILPFPEGVGIYQLPIAAVVLSAWYGGRGPGWFTTLVCAPGLMYWFVPPVNSFEVLPHHEPAYFIFIALCLLVSEFSAGRRRAEHQTGVLAAIVESSDDAIISKDMDGIITTWNASAERMFGYAAGEVIGKPVKILAPPDRVDEMRAILERIRRGERVDHIETVRRRKDGTLLDISLTVSPIIDANGAVVGASKIARDISERKRTENALRETDNALEMARAELAHVARVSALGELTTSIAHEIAQPLGGMIASAGAGTRWLSTEPPDIAEARAALANIAADGKRARDVIARIRALTKRQTPRKETLDFNHEVLEVLALTERELRRHDIMLRTQLDSTLPHLQGDRIQLQQVLINLILNAIEAMSGVNDRPRELTIVSTQDGPNAVWVEVRDSGTGLDAKSAEKVFEAFYTTKSNGIGIGLSITRSIVEAHGGRLCVSPSEPHGAVFRFSLPVTEEALS